MASFAVQGVHPDGHPWDPAAVIALAEDNRITEEIAMRMLQDRGWSPNVVRRYCPFWLGGLLQRRAFLSLQQDNIITADVAMQSLEDGKWPQNVAKF